MEEKEKTNGSTELFNSFNERHLQLGRFKDSKYSMRQIEDVWINNISNVLVSLQKVSTLGIKNVRLSSNLFPLFDFFTKELDDNREISSILLEIGRFALSNNMRITTHPDQFVVLSSRNPKVIENSINILSHHAWVFDKMGLPQTAYYCINIHGGVKGEQETLIRSINRLPISVRSRLTLENDEKSYNTQDLFKVFELTGVPVCFDAHHHTFNTAGLTMEDALFLAMSTWKTKPLTHLSNTEPGSENGSFNDRRKHSNYMHYIPECQRLANNSGLIDIDCEFKMKNLAIFKAIEDFDIKL